MTAVDSSDDSSIWSHMGTTRTGSDPDGSAVDSNHRAHGIENLFVTSSSIFPTSRGMNPTLTIAALSLRLADHLDERL
jgi:choline dehydrogenase-like flavoprotein